MERRRIIDTEHNSLGWSNEPRKKIKAHPQRTFFTQEFWENSVNVAEQCTNEPRYNGLKKRNYSRAHLSRRRVDQEVLLRITRT